MRIINGVIENFHGFSEKLGNVPKLYETLGILGKLWETLGNFGNVIWEIFQPRRRVRRP
jgi:hypothetical protein